MAWSFEQEWYDARIDVLERDGYRCQALLRDGNQCTRSGQSLHVHHIVPAAQGGAVFDAENLVALCSVCHPSVEAGRLTFIDAQERTCPSA